MDLDAVMALMHIHLRQDPMELVEEGPDGELKWDQFALTWNRLKFVLEYERTTNAKLPQL